MSDPIVELQNITKDYDRIRALDDVSLRVGGGVTGLLGPNGAGKSTLIKVLLGLVDLTQGSGSVLGYDLESEARDIRQRVGFMPEDDCYISGLTGIEMVHFEARLSGQPLVEGLRRSHEILDFCGVEQERYRMVDTFSTGMRQKVKFAQSLVHDPDLLILDEPTAGLDPEERQAMLSRIGILARRAGKAVLLSTHILPDVQAVCDDVVIMAAGRVVVQESLEVLSRPVSPTFQLQVHGETNGLIERLRGEGAEVLRQTNGALVVTSQDNGLARRLWTWAREERWMIQSLVPSRNSLEQIFFEAVQETASRRADQEALRADT